MIKNPGGRRKDQAVILSRNGMPIHKQNAAGNRFQMPVDKPYPLMYNDAYTPIGIGTEVWI